MSELTWIPPGQKEQQRTPGPGLHPATEWEGAAGCPLALRTLITKKALRKNTGPFWAEVYQKWK